MASVPVSGGGASVPAGAEAPPIATAATGSTRNGKRRVVALGVGALAVVEVALAVALWSAGGRSFAYLLAGHEVNASVVAVSFGVIGAAAMYLSPGNRLGWLLLLISQLVGLAVLTDAYATPSLGLPGADPARWVSEWFWVPAFAALLSLMTPLFPDGRPASPRSSLLAKAGLIITGTTILVAPVLLEIAPSTPIPAPPSWQAPLAWATLALLAGALFVGTIGAVGLAVRAARTTGAERRQIIWFFTGFIVLVLTTVLPLGLVVQLIGTAFFPVAVGIAMLRYGLFDADRLLNRALLYATLSLLVAAVVAACIALSIAWAGGSGLGAVVAGVVVTIGLVPARDVVQRGIDRLLYGQRRDPYAAMTGLAGRLSSAVAPSDMLTVIVETVTDALRLPYAGVIVGDDPIPAAVAGRPPARVADLALRHAGERVGVLSVGLRDGAPALDPTDDRLLADVARQAGAVAHTVRLTRNVQLAYDRLATARDEERHRIRRDMHDELGPLLAGVVLGLGAARRAADGRLPEQAELLARLQAQVSEGLDDVKRLIADLRPTALDELGLVAALERHASLLSTDDGSGLQVQVITAGSLPALPSDVEVAAYRICLEALANAVRHGRATSARVCLELRDVDLHLRIEDDGIGLPDQMSSQGLGLASMAARARDVGGSCTVNRRPSEGTIVDARLPLPAPLLPDQESRASTGPETT
jgi:signal transduction histidine kinase